MLTRRAAPRAAGERYGWAECVPRQASHAWLGIFMSRVLPTASPDTTAGHPCSGAPDAAQRSRSTVARTHNYTTVCVCATRRFEDNSHAPRVLCGLLYDRPNGAFSGWSEPWQAHTVWIQPLAQPSMLSALAHARCGVATPHTASHATRGALWTLGGKTCAQDQNELSPLPVTPMRPGFWHVLTDTSLTPHTPP
jgi:hypothetical protein